MADTIIWHNPKCSTSRTVLGLIRNAGVEPQIRDYLTAPPTTAEIAAALRATGLRPRDLIRAKGDLYAELGLDAPDLSDEALIAAMAAHPALIERPLVFTPKGTALGRPPLAVLDLLPPQRGPFRSERGVQLVGDDGQPVAR